MRTWTETGFGVDAEIFDGVSTEKKVGFIKKHDRARYIEIMKAADVSTDKAEFSEDERNALAEALEDMEDAFCYRGFPGAFAEIIADSEDGIDVCFCVGEHESAVLYEDRAPWEMSDRVGAMKSPAEMKAVFAKYLKELGIDDFDFSRQSVEMYG